MKFFLAQFYYLLALVVLGGKYFYFKCNGANNLCVYNTIVFRYESLDMRCRRRVFKIAYRANIHQKKHQNGVVDGVYEMIYLK